MYVFVIIIAFILPYVVGTSFYAVGLVIMALYLAFMSVVMIVIIFSPDMQGKIANELLRNKKQLEKWTLLHYLDIVLTVSATVWLASHGMYLVAMALLVTFMISRHLALMINQEVKKVRDESLE